MTEDFEIIKSEKGETTRLRKFEEVVESAEVIYYTENHIEIPGIIIFSKEKKGFLFQVMNPGMEIFSINEEDYNKMIELLLVREKDVISFKTKTTPVATVRLNLKKIKENLILIRESKNILVLNKTLLTTNEFEFQGSGMFTGKENVFLVSKEVFDNIKDYLA